MNSKFVVIFDARKTAIEAFSIGPMTPHNVTGNDSRSKFVTSRVPKKATFIILRKEALSGRQSNIRFLQLT